MQREASAGGVVVREADGGGLEVALIRPHARPLWALPKGHIDPGESPEVAAAREVREETGLSVTLEAPLGDIEYAYVFRGERIHKRVHFFLFRYAAGALGALTTERVEVDEVRWVPLGDAVQLLGYRGERSVAERAVDYLARAARSTLPAHGG